ncbi:uncharacterized protein EV420DRAFT_1750348 [Desarmillaria tabescens]|uniref:Uncharacterized protein n=1 Tax=Armillaria tabescens TaxID=1929756 RepID=A0AA39JX59_ARMTA|nr:uncharacterized protein EV420DRAFT_1750348 [Desarmillaria tabescens]KAK0450562.1 hypothetical protein EV420DRAFT_1750348 [Desarmillaria tabescens]
MFGRSAYASEDWPLIPRLPEEADETKRHIAKNIQQVTEENEQYIRSYHPAFEDADFVFVYCNPSSLRESVWMVERSIFSDTTPPPTGTREELSGRYRPIEDPLALIRRDLNPRVPLSDADISVIRKWWPNIIGVRVYVYGVISLLVHQWNDCDEVRARYGWPMKIGGLRSQIETIQDIKPSADEAGTGRRWHTDTEIGSTSGLRIGSRFGFGADKDTVSDAITTNTHSFVYAPRDVPMQQILFDIVRDTFLRIKYCIASTKTCRALCDWRPMSWALTQLVGDSSPLGKEVYAASQKAGLLRVGKVTKCYDSPSLVFTYPFGYRHDLPLITDISLPEITAPPGLPIISGFEPTFDAALRLGCPLFAASYRSGDRPMAVPVQAVATQYTWEPGSALCLGSIGACETRVVAFQNFEADLRHGLWNVPLVKDQRRYLRYKGGFALPREVLESQVVMQEPGI